MWRVLSHVVGGNADLTAQVFASSRHRCFLSPELPFTSNHNNHNNQFFPRRAPGRPRLHSARPRLLQQPSLSPLRAPQGTPAPFSLAVSLLSRCPLRHRARANKDCRWVLRQGPMLITSDPTACERISAGEAIRPLWLGGSKRLLPPNPPLFLLSLSRSQARSRFVQRLLMAHRLQLPTLTHSLRVHTA